MDWTDHQARTLLRAAFDAAIASADPHRVLAPHLPERPPGRTQGHAAGRTIVVGAGKSAAAMAAALENAMEREGHPIHHGLVVTRYGHEAPTRQIEVLQSSHPVPDAASEHAATRILQAVQGLTANDLVIVLMSGGASALMELPAPGLTLDDLRRVNADLLASGAPIGAMNAVRKHLSAIKGGRLAQAASPARVVTLAISDVPGDDPGTIGSGPTMPDPTTWADVRAIAARYHLHLPRTDGPETPKPGLVATDFRLIASPMRALEAAADAIRAAGATPLILGDAIEGDSAEAATVMAGIARSAKAHGHPARTPCVLLSGGETTVTLPANHRGKGGRNTEFLLALATALRAQPGIWAIAGDTDGIDGNQDAAGAIIAPDTIARAHQAGLDPAAFLAAHDSYTLFDTLNDLVRTGPTLTNVNDIRAILVA